MTPSETEGLTVRYHITRFENYGQVQEKKTRKSYSLYSFLGWLWREILVSVACLGEEKEAIERRQEKVREIALSG